LLSIPRLWGNPKKPLANQFCRDSSPGMIRAGFLDPESRSDLIDLARDGSVAHRLARRANALVFAFGMFLVTEADADAIRAIFNQEGELSAAIELRRRFPGITDNVKARGRCRRPTTGPSRLHRNSSHHPTLAACRTAGKRVPSYGSHQYANYLHG
jgi:hypothetical protein